MLTINSSPFNKTTTDESPLWRTILATLRMKIVMAAPNEKKRGLEHLDEYEPKPAKHLRSLHDRMAERRLVVILEGASLETVKVKHHSHYYSGDFIKIILPLPTVTEVTSVTTYFLCLQGWENIWTVKLWPAQKHDRQKWKESGQHQTRYYTSGKGLCLKLWLMMYHILDMIRGY